MFPQFYPFSQVPQGVHLHIRVSPRAAKNRLGKVEMDKTGAPFLKVYVTAPPEDGKANEALIKLLAEAIDLAKSKFQIIRGQADRQKVLLIEGDSQSIYEALVLSL